MALNSGWQSSNVRTQCGTLSLCRNTVVSECREVNTSTNASIYTSRHDGSAASRPRSTHQDAPFPPSRLKTAHRPAGSLPRSTNLKACALRTETGRKPNGEQPISRRGKRCRERWVRLHMAITRYMPHKLHHHPHDAHSNIGKKENNARGQQKGGILPDHRLPCPRTPHVMLPDLFLCPCNPLRTTTTSRVAPPPPRREYVENEARRQNQSESYATSVADFF